MIAEQVATIRRYSLQAERQLSDMVAASQAGAPPAETARSSLEALSATLEQLREAEAAMQEAQESWVNANSRTAQELRTFRLHFMDAPCAYVITDSNGVIRAANSAMASLLSADLPGVIGKPLLSYVSEPDRRDFRRLLATAEKDGATRDCRVTVVSRSGETRDVVGLVRAIPRTVGGPTGLRWILQEVGAPGVSEARAQLRAAPRENGHIAKLLIDVDESGRAAIDSSSKRARGRRFAQELELRFLRALFEGDLLPADRLPGIRALSRAWNLNYKVVRRFYQSLQADGFVEIRARSGVVVAPHDRGALALTREQRWLARNLAEAWSSGVSVSGALDLLAGHLPGGGVRCACLGSVDHACTVVAELRNSFGIDAYGVSLIEENSRGVAAMQSELLGARVVVSPPQYVSEVRRLVGNSVPVVLITRDAANSGTRGANGTRPPFSAQSLQRILEAVLFAARTAAAAAA